VTAAISPEALSLAAFCAILAVGAALWGLTSIWCRYRGERGSYALSRADRSGVEDEIDVFERLDDALSTRDHLRASSNPRSVQHRVTDLEDPERGDAEWCGECSRHGTFGYACEACR
jgi:hypothetical protein